MKPSLLFTGLFIFLITSALVSANPYDEAIEKALNDPTIENIIELGRNLRGLGRRSQKSENYYKIRSTLLSIPDHAKFYEQIIKSETDSRDRMWHFETLSHLPSPETVRVLGEMLSDTKHYLPPEERNFDTQLMKSNAEYAVKLLEEFKLAKIQREKPWAGVVMEDIERWKEWYEQVKAGRATFRFEGDPQEYTLEGTVGEAKHERAADQASRRRALVEDPGEEEKSGVSPVRVIAIAGAVLLCLLALWRYGKIRATPVG